MRVVHISTEDARGGAYIAAHRLHQALNQLGVDSWMVVNRKNTQDPKVVAPDWPGYLWGRIAPRLDRLAKRLIKTPNKDLAINWVPEVTARRVLTLKPDIVHIQGIVSGMLRPESLQKFAHLPLIWTFHDMWPMLGAEHIAQDRRYIKGYSSKTRPNFESGFDLNQWVWQRKLRSVSKIKNLTVVAPSRWLYDRTHESYIFKDKKIKLIGNPLDTTLFRSHQPIQARKKFKLSPHKTLLGFGAIDALNKNKGLDLLIKALMILKKEQWLENKLELVIFGATGANYLPLPYPTHFLPRIGQESQMPWLYSALDSFVMPSRVEALGYTAMEAMACERPVAAFDATGIQDLVDHGYNGYLAKPYQPADLAQGIKQILKHARTWGKNARSKIVAKYRSSKVAKEYFKVYKEAIRD